MMRCLCGQKPICCGSAVLMIIGLVPVFIVTVMFILNFVHCEITACDSDKTDLTKSYLITLTTAR